RVRRVVATTGEHGVHCKVDALRCVHLSQQPCSDLGEPQLLRIDKIQPSLKVTWILGGLSVHDPWMCRGDYKVWASILHEASQHRLHGLRVLVELNYTVHDGPSLVAVEWLEVEQEDFLSRDVGLC